jgi:hypothetical protein
MLGDRFGVAGRMEHVVTDSELGRERHGHTSTMRRLVFHELSRAASS